jgi:hypothetical protein
VFVRVWGFLGPKQIRNCSYVVFFRLDGPFALRQAQATSENELWQPVIDRSYSANALFIVLAVAFGWMSVGAN